MYLLFCFPSPPLTIDIVLGEIHVLVITVVRVVERFQVRQHSGPTDLVRLQRWKWHSFFSVASLW